MKIINSITSASKVVSFLQKLYGISEPGFESRMIIVKGIVSEYSFIYGCFSGNLFSGGFFSSESIMVGVGVWEPLLMRFANDFVKVKSWR